MESKQLAAVFSIVAIMAAVIIAGFFTFGTSSCQTLQFSSYSASPANGNPPLTVTFTGAASGGCGGYTYIIHYGDGSNSGTFSGTPFSQTHTYTSIGTYNAKLSVTSSDGEQASISITIQVGSTTTTSSSSTTSIYSTTSQALTVTISSSLPSTTTGTVVQFNAAVSGGSGIFTSYSWTFGDGSTSTQSAPTHVYTNSGNFQVSLAVQDSVGNTGSGTFTETISSQPVTTQTTQTLTTTNAAGQTITTTSIGQTTITTTACGSNMFWPSNLPTCWANSNVSIGSASAGGPYQLDSDLTISGISTTPNMVWIAWNPDTFMLEYSAMGAESVTLQVSQMPSAVYGDNSLINSWSYNGNTLTISPSGNTYITLEFSSIISTPSGGFYGLDATQQILVALIVVTTVVLAAAGAFVYQKGRS